MQSINVGHLYKKRTVRRLSGDIIDLIDEANGGYIIKGGRVVNQERFDEMRKIEEDKKVAAQAILHQKVDESAPDRNMTAQEAVKQSTKMEELEKKNEELNTKFDALDTKLDAILKAITK